MGVVIEEVVGAVTGDERRGTDEGEELVERPPRHVPTLQDLDERLRALERRRRRLMAD